MRHATVLVAILAFVPLASATAQEPPPVKVGDRVRVTAPDLGRRVGTVQLLTTDSLVMRLEYSIWPVAIPLASATRLEVSRGQKSRMGLGASIGVSGGVLLGYLISSGSCSGESFLVPSREACIVVSTVGGAFVGTFLGVVVGTMASTDKWRAVPLVRVAPQQDGRFGFGASVRF